MLETFLAFVEAMPAWQKLAWVFLVLGFSWVLEAAIPLVPLRYRKLRHAGVNGAFLATSLLINAAFGVATVVVAAWTREHGIGLLHLVDLPLWAELLLALAALDLMAQYIAHYLLHRVKWLWRMHVVHHSDTKVDATTGVRLHPGDYAFRETFALVAVVATGAPLAFYLLYRVITIFFTLITHANVSPPPALDAALSWVVVTPNMHKFHHHFERPWTDTNFGGILSIWDRVFGTFVYGDPHEVIYGVDVADPDRDEELLHQFALPFTEQKRLDRPWMRGGRARDDASESR